MPALKTPVDKLPLTARKNIRDEWESKKPDFESDISRLLGEAWTIETNINLIYAYAPEDYAPRLGSVITWYIEPVVSNINQFIEAFGEDGKTELNTIVSKHKIVLGPQEKTTFNYGGLVVEDGTLHLVFADGAFASNVNEISKDIAGALAAAPASTSGSAFNLIARNSVRDDYDSKISDIASKIRKAVNMPDLKLNGNFEAVATELAKSAEEGWQKRIGFLTLAYFEGLEEVLRRNGFEGDDMLQEAFQEGVAKGEVCIRVFQKWPDNNSRYNEVVLEDGILYIQTIVEYFGSNVSDAALKITDIL